MTGVQTCALPIYANKFIVYGLDVNGINTAQVVYYTTSTIDGGNSWVTSNYAGNTAIFSGVPNIFSTIDNEVLTALNRQIANNPNIASNTIQLYRSTDDGLSFSFVSNTTAPNSVGTVNSFYDKNKGRIVLLGDDTNYLNYNPGNSTYTTVYGSNEFSSTTTIPTIVLYDSNGNVYDDVTIGSYQSLGSGAGTSMTMIIKTA